MSVKIPMANIRKTLGRKEKLIPYLEKALADFDEPFSFTYEPKESDDAWHPSGDCTPSPHDLYLKAKSTEGERIGAQLRKTFLVGHFWHQLLQYLIVEKTDLAGPDEIERRGVKGWGEKQRVYFGGSGDGIPMWRPYHWATGAADIAPCRIPVHGDYLVDFKTMKSADFKRLPRLPDWCADKYEAQFNIYMDWFDLEKAIAFCINKDSPHDFREVEFHRNQPLIDAIYHKWEIVGQCLEEGIVPPEDEYIHLPLQGPIE